MMHRKSMALLGLTLACLGGLVLTGACGDGGTAGTAEQRDLGDIALNANLFFSLRSGTIDQHTQSAVEARASMPLPQFSLSTGPVAVEQVRVTLRNIHRDAVIRVLRSAPNTARTTPGCPTQTDRDTIVCAETPEHAECEAPDFTRPDPKRAEASLVVDLAGCTRRSFSVELEETTEHPTRLAVLGRTESYEQLRRALEVATADAPDFVVLLGDAVENSSFSSLRSLDFLLRTIDFPVVMLPGEDELVDENRQHFLEVFGPLDFGWQVRNVHFYAFYSARARLSEDGLTRLRTVLSRMQPEHPTLLFTHTPPTDPLGPRDQGFRSQIQAARILSLISESTVDAFFVGHINDSATVDINSIKMYLTSVERSQQFLSVQVDGDDIRVTRRPL